MSLPLAPLVHLNGTSRLELATRAGDAHRRLSAAIDALVGMAPNARDYYPLGPDAFSTALTEYRARFAALQEVDNEIAFIRNAIEAQA